MGMTFLFQLSHVILAWSSKTNMAVFLAECSDTMVSHGGYGIVDYRYVFPHHKGLSVTQGRSGYLSRGKKMGVMKWPNMGKKDQNNGGEADSRRLMAVKEDFNGGGSQVDTSHMGATAAKVDQNIHSNSSRVLWLKMVENVKKLI